MSKAKNAAKSLQSLLNDFGYAVVSKADVEAIRNAMNHGMEVLCNHNSDQDDIDSMDVGCQAIDRVLEGLSRGAILGHCQNILAKTGGKKAWQAVIAAKPESNGVLVCDSDTDYTLPDNARSVWVSVKGHSVYINPTDEGVVVDIYAKGAAIGGSVASAYAFDSDSESAFCEDKGIDIDDVAEWVGQHYKVNFDAESASRRMEWLHRYDDSHERPTTKYHVVVYAVGEDGNRSKLGEGDFDAESESIAEGIAFKQHWDDRLNAASCSPAFETNEYEAKDPANVIGKSLYSGDIGVTLDYCNEGHDGDYNQKDPTDEPLMRFDIVQRDGEDGQFVDFDCASGCCQLNYATSTLQQRQRFLEIAMCYAEEYVVKQQRAAKHVVGAITWVGADWDGQLNGYAVPEGLQAVLDKWKELSLAPVQNSVQQSLDPVPFKESGIIAEVHSDDRVFEVDFDATPWFRQASNDEIIALAEIGWGGDSEADEVAEFCEAGNNEITEMFSYLRRLSGRRNACGSECHVDEDSAMDWIRTNRPELASKIEGTSEKFECSKCGLPTSVDEDGLCNNCSKKSEVAAAIKAEFLTSSEGAAEVELFHERLMSECPGFFVDHDAAVAFLMAD